MKTAALNTVYRILDPVVLTLHRMGVKPNTITSASLFFAVAGAVLLGGGKPVFALLALSLAGLCDVLDGHLARTTRQQSAAGAFFDSFVDRLSDGAVLLGFAYIGMQHSPALAGASLLSVMAAFAVSYARARGESLGADVRIGPMTRPARHLFLIALLVGYALTIHIPDLFAVRVLEIGMSVFFVATMFTAIMRANLTMRQLESS